MSASKDALSSSGVRRSWKRSTRARRCPVCGHDSWCTVMDDGSVAVCMRDSSGIERTDRAGGTYWIHVLDPSIPREIVGPDVPVGIERASVDVLDTAYRSLLAELRLNEDHANGLRKRGLDDAWIRRRMYRSLGVEGRSAVARAVVARVGESCAAGVPGLYVAQQDGRTWWSLAGSAGMLIPVLDTDGRIVAIKIRSDGEDGSKYTYLSSGHRGGATALLAVHVPSFSDSREYSDVRVTEGELKADVATALSDVPTLSIPGVGSWRAAIPVLHAFGPKRVLLAFDADHRTKPEVGAACAALARECVREGFSIAFERWDARRGKGIDDVLASGAASAIRTIGYEYAEWVEQTARAQREARKAG
jgi:hypothetical protein